MGINFEGFYSQYVHFSIIWHYVILWSLKRNIILEQNLGGYGLYLGWHVVLVRCLLKVFSGLLSLVYLEHLSLGNWRAFSSRKNV